MNMTPERIRSSYDEMVDMGMKALVEEAAANSGASTGAGKDWEHVDIRQCAWWLVALATLKLFDLNAQRTRERTRARRRTFSFAHNSRACRSHRTPPHSA